MSIIKEFKDFAIKGNVVDMAVGLVIGASFGKIVTTFVAKVFTPPLGLLLGGVNFNQLKFVLKDASESNAEIAVGYGEFLQVTIDFIIVAFAIFLVVKAMNSLKKKEEAAPSAPAVPTVSEELLKEIRDLLKK